ncbi:MAG: folate-binding protein [Aquimonas sp.]|nr:folate-binding protein [Aquimonas sp.]
MLTIEGPDALAFAQSQLTSNITQLTTGGWQWSSWLSAKGRVIAVFALLKESEERLLLFLPDHPATTLAPQLARFVLRRKAKVTAAEALDVIAGFGGVRPAGALELGDAPDRWISAGPAGACAPADAAFERAWLLADIRLGLPRLDAEGGQHTAHMLSLDLLGALSLDKGCYPGQEIVARTHYLGQSRRRLTRLRTEHGVDAARGSAVLRNGSVAGELLCIATDAAGGCELQCVLAEGDDSGELALGDGTRLART